VVRGQAVNGIIINAEAREKRRDQLSSRGIFLKIDEDAGIVLQTAELRAWPA
jgi:hypothetical protein